MSKEGEGRKAALVRFKVITALLGLLSVCLLLCSGIGIEFYDDDKHGIPYFAGGFIVGTPALVATLISMSVLAKAIGKDANDAKLKKLAPLISCQYSMTMLMLPFCFIGSVLVGVGGFSGEDKDRPQGRNKSLATVILAGCILTFCVIVVSMCTVCEYGKYFGVIINKRGRRTVIITDETSDGRADRGVDGGMSVHTNVNVFTTGTNNQHVSQLEQQNRLLQQQLQLQQQLLNQQQQQQNQFAGGMYPPPPLYNDPDPAYPPSAPPPPYSKDL